MAFSGITLNYILRVNINFALVAMVKHGPANASAAAVNHTASGSGEDLLFLNGSAPWMGLYNATDADGGSAVLVAQEKKDATSAATLAAELDMCPAPEEHTESHATYVSCMECCWLFSFLFFFPFSLFLFLFLSALHFFS